NAFESHLAGMGEHCRTIALDVFVEPDTGTGLGQDRRERGLADLKRIIPQIIAIQFNQVEGIEERIAIMTSVRDASPATAASNSRTLRRCSGSPQASARSPGSQGSPGRRSTGSRMIGL